YHRPLILFSPLLSSASLDSVADGGRVRPPTSRRAVEEADRSATVGGYVKVTCTDETYDGEEVHGGECCHWWVRCQHASLGGARNRTSDFDVCKRRRWSILEQRWKIASWMPGVELFWM
ncbi:unnamed protein product, partial [Urochloa humidicola]